MVRINLLTGFREWLLTAIRASGFLGCLGLRMALRLLLRTWVRRVPTGLFVGNLRLMQLLRDWFA